MHSYALMSALVDERKNQVAADAARPRWERGARPPGLGSLRRPLTRRRVG